MSIEWIFFCSLTEKAKCYRAHPVIQSEFSAQNSTYLRVDKRQSFLIRSEDQWENVMAVITMRIVRLNRQNTILLLVQLTQ